MKKTIFFILVLVMFLTTAGHRAFAGFNDEYKFNEVINLGANINTPYKEAHPTLTADGCTMYFESDRPGGYGKQDIYVSYKVDGVWQQAQNMGTVINTSNHETNPFISPDGNVLYFVSDRNQRPNFTKIWKIEKVDGVWQTPTMLPGTVNISWINNNFPFLSPDGNWLYTSIFYGPGGYGMWDAYRSQIVNGEYLQSEHLPAPVNTRYRDGSAALTSDGKYFIFWSDRALWGMSRLYVSEIVDGVYQAPKLLASPFDKRNMTLRFTENETVAYMGTNENIPGGFGGFDIYYATRIMPYIEAYMEVFPHAINLKSKGNYVTCYIELEDGYNVADIDVSTLTLTTEDSQDTVAAELSPTEIGDNNGNGVPDLMVKFDRSMVHNLLTNADGESLLFLDGNLLDSTQLKGYEAVIYFIKGNDHTNEVDPASVSE
jgi:hypothetical protein